MNSKLHTGPIIAFALLLWAGSAMAQESPAERLTHADGEVRAQALEALLRENYPANVDRVTTFLRDPSAKVRREAARLLGNLKLASFAPRLAELLTDRNIEVREMAMSQLSHNPGGAQYADHMALRLQDSSPSVRGWALHHLYDTTWGTLKAGDRYRGEVARLLHDPAVEVVRRALQIIESRGYREAVPEVASLLRHGDFAVRSRAAEALGSLGATEHRAAIEALLQDAKVYRSDVIDALVKLDMKSPHPARPRPINVDTMIFGFEPTATDAETMSQNRAYREDDAKRDRVVREFIRLLAGEAVEEGRTEFPVKLKVRWQGELWKFGTDPGVIEVQPPPMKLADVERKLGVLHEAFVAAGLRTTYPGGVEGTGAHIHVGTEIFENNPLLLRNLLVDLHNRPYIASAFYAIGDHHNAATVFERGEQEKLAESIARIDAAARKNGRYDYREIMVELGRWYLTNRYRDLNLMNARDELAARLRSHYEPVDMKGQLRTVEFRQFGSQRDATDARRQALFLGRYLKKLEGINRPIGFRRHTPATYEALRTPAAMDRALRPLLGELGLPPEEYAHFLDRRRKTPLRFGGAGDALEIRWYDWIREDGRGNIDATRFMYEVRVPPEVKQLIVSGKRVPIVDLGGGVRVATVTALKGAALELRALDSGGRSLAALSRTITFQEIVNARHAALMAAQDESTRRMIEEAKFRIVLADTAVMAGAAVRLDGLRLLMDRNQPDAVLTEALRKVMASRSGGAVPQGQSNREAGRVSFFHVDGIGGQLYKGTAGFGTGVLLKGATDSAIHRDIRKLKTAVKDVLSPEFAAATGVFTGVQMGVNKGLEKGRVGGKRAAITRLLLPVAGANIALQAAAGRIDPELAARQTASLGIASVATMPAGRLLQRTVTRSLGKVGGPIGWAVSGGLTAVDVTMLLYGMEGVDPWLEKGVEAAKKSWQP